MKLKSSLQIAIFLLAFFPRVSSQTISEPLDNQVYSFLDRLSMKNIISLKNEVKPYSRKQIAQWLTQAETGYDKLNEIEREELLFFQEEYSFELKNEKQRWRLFQYQDSLFQVKLSPIAGYYVSSYDKLSGFNKNWGIRVFSSYAKSFSASIQMTDNGEYGDNVDENKYLTPIKGASNIQVKNGIEFSDVRGALGYDFGWGSITLKKEYNDWGFASFGNIVLSKKAPSYPHIYFQLQPVEWLRFYYIHAWLNSQVIDSSGFIGGSYVYETDRQKFIPKYLVANMLAVSPIKNLDIYVGNSIIYKGELRSEFFIPFLFYKYLDRDVGKGSVEDGNGQLYFGVNANYPIKTKFYSSFFLEVTELRNVFKSDFSNTWFGFNFGCKRIDVFTDNLDLTLEYTRINPWTYEHKAEVTNYKHLNYSLGHWIGTNADFLKAAVDYKVLRGFNISIFVERIRKGGIADMKSVYTNLTETPFLEGDLRKEFRIGLNAVYEIYHEAFAHLNFQYSDITDADKTRTPAFMIGKKSSFKIGLQYGLN
jgi:hypothetical protein